MKIIDLTYFLENHMIVFSEEEKINIERTYTIEENGFRESNFNIFSHNGTHIDAPAHILPEGKYLEDFPLEQFQGNALLIDLENHFLTSNYKITIDLLLPYKEHIKNHEILILKTGFCKYWNTPKYLLNYPTLTIEATNYLASFNLKIIGIDTISPDEYHSINLPIHHILLKNEILILENLNLTPLLPKSFKLMAMPMKYKNSDGSFLRAIAII